MGLLAKPPAAAAAPCCCRRARPHVPSRCIAAGLGDAQAAAAEAAAPVAAPPAPVAAAAAARPKGFGSGRPAPPPPPADPCPCGSGAGYESCCGPLHAGSAPAPSASAVMRARFSAYVRGGPALGYIVSTTHPRSADLVQRGESPEAAAAQLLRDAEATWRNCAFQTLEVVKDDRGATEDERWVTFRAHWSQRAAAADAARFKSGRWSRDKGTSKTLVEKARAAPPPMPAFADQYKTNRSPSWRCLLIARFNPRPRPLPAEPLPVPPGGRGVSGAVAVHIGAWGGAAAVCAVLPAGEAGWRPRR